MKDLEHLAKLINRFPSDIKAEVLMADLFEEGFTQSDFVIFYDSLFKRRYSRDILKAAKMFINDYEEIMAVYLARDGLYDLLPEGLFHSYPGSAVNSGKDMADNSRKEAKIEEEARKFFRPIENEFFYQRVQLELQERFMLRKFNDNSMDDFFLNFWQIDQSLPREFTVKFVTMLSFIKEIVGDFNMTANCLGMILGETVTHSIRYSGETQISTHLLKKEEESRLGRSNLGVDLVTDGHFVEGSKTITFHIGPLKRTGADPYLKDGSIAKFIDSFCGFFIPMEMNYEFEVFMQKELQEFILDPEVNPCILGYNTVI